MSGSRIVDHVGARNMRDLGGLCTPTGRVIRGRLFRAGFLGELSQEAAGALVARTGLRYYLDLRSDEEVTRFGPPESLIRQGVQWERVPMDHSEPMVAIHHEQPRPSDYFDYYRAVLAVVSDPAERAVSLALSGPTVFACSWGKDRTGLVAASILIGLGVRLSDVASDFALSTRCLVYGPAARGCESKRSFPDAARRCAASARAMCALCEWLETSGSSERATLAAAITDQARRGMIETKP